MSKAKTPAADSNSANRSVSKKYVRQSQFRLTIHQLRKNVGAMIGLFVIVSIMLVAIFADYIIDYDKVVGIHMTEASLGPCWEHPFGTDDLGRDIFARVMYGSRYSLSVGLAAVVIGLSIGVTLGAIAGFYGGLAEDIIMRCNDILSAIPAILMGVVIVSALGTSTFNLMLAIGVTSVPQFVRITRASVMTVRNQEYIEALRASGLSEARIIAAHVLPNSISPIIVQATLRIASAIVAASTLSYLGMGIPAPAPEWGAMLSMGRDYVRTLPHMTIFPGLTILVVVLSFNLLGDGLRDAMDPKLKK